MPPNPKECLLRDVFRGCTVQAHPSQVGEDPVLMRHHDPTERQMVALGGLADIRVTVQGVAPDLPYILARSAMVTGRHQRDTPAEPSRLLRRRLAASLAEGQLRARAISRTVGHSSQPALGPN